MQSDLHFCQIVVKIEFSRHVFIRRPNMKFHENPSSRSRADKYGQTRALRRQTGASRGNANAPKNAYIPSPQ
jgi:hypothetical protein